MIKSSSFLAIEGSLTKKLYDSYIKHTKKLFPQVESALAEGRYGDAATLVNGFSLSPVFVEQRKSIEYLTNIAMLFGASRVTSRPGTSVVGLGLEKAATFQFLQSFQQAITIRGELFLKAQALQLISNHKSQSGEVTVNKAERIIQPFSSFMDKAGEAMFNIASSLHTSRVSGYGFTAEAQALGLKRYQITEVLDKRICPVCRAMHGKTFSVSAARSFLDVVTRTTNPEELKQLQPWPSQSVEDVDALIAMDEVELVSHGWHVPPYHPRCRGLLTRVGKAVPIPEGQDEPLPEPDRYDTSTEDFKALGFKVSEGLVDRWNSIVGLSPSEVVSRLQGYEVDEFLATLSSGVAESGLSSISSTSKLIKMGLNGVAFNSTEAVVQRYIFQQGSLFIDEISVSAADAPIAQQVVKAAYSVARSMGADSLSLSVGLDTGGWSWAKYGFAPSVNGWLSLSKNLYSKLASMPLTAIEKRPIELILASKDPLSIFTLADLPMGKELLSGTEWKGFLDFSNSEAVTRFLSYMG